MSVLLDTSESFVSDFLNISALFSFHLFRTDDRYHPSQQQPPHQQPPWVQHHRELKHLPDTHERFSQPLRLRRSPFSRSRTRSRTASRTPSRSMDRTLAPRSSRSRSRSPGRSRSTSRTGRSSRSRSPTTDIALEKSEFRCSMLRLCYCCGRECSWKAHAMRSATEMGKYNM